MCFGIFGGLSLDYELPLAVALKLTQLAQVSGNLDELRLGRSECMTEFR
jgi:hypothetical protein